MSIVVPTGTSPDLSLVLACYNEGPLLERSVETILSVLDLSRFTYEIVFVDDASTDGTRRTIERIVAGHPRHAMRCVLHERNTGRGRAVADGFRAAAGSIVGYIDPDLEVGPHYIAACCLAIRLGADLAVGQRVYTFSFRRLIRYVLSRAYARLARRLLPLGGVTDSESGYKFFRRDAGLALVEQVRDSGWFWDTEIVIRATLGGFRIAQIPCLFIRNLEKRSTVRPLRDSLEYLYRALQFRRTLRREGLARESEAYWRRRAGAFAAQYGGRRVAGRFVGGFLTRRARLLSEWLRLPRGMKALDLGCGHGLYLEALAEQGAHVTGVDVSAEMVSLARERLRTFGAVSAELHCGRVEDVALPESAFDLVMSVGLLDYVSDWRTLLRRIARYAKPGGWVVVTLPKRPSPFFFLRSGPGLWLRRVVLHLPPILSAATRGELEEAAGAAGLELVAVVSCQATMWAVRARRV